RTDEQMVQRASGAGLAGVTVPEVQTAMSRVYVPANAVLSLAGDLQGVDLHAEIERRFGAIPAGVARPEPPPTRLTPAERVIHRTGDPAAVVGVIAPALTDTLSPTFYVGALLYAGVADQTWYTTGTPHGVLYQYPLFDEPELLRFYPLVKPGETDFAPIQKRMLELGELTRGMIVDPGSYRDMKNTITWLMGGAMGADQAASVRRNRPALMTLSRAQASCELRGGHVFWERYRKRLAAVLPGRPEEMSAWITNPVHQIRLLWLPSGK
ncbi:MAG TPA: insulinase family protein, partial [Dongiaceae bacterium]|nr:insulinase family protein [Dongiaceae bacterium]